MNYFKYLVLIVIVFLLWCLSGCNSSYSITFIPNDGNECYSLSFYDGEEINLMTPNREGYTFEGWYEDKELGKEFTNLVMPKENITIYAKWSVNQYTINFNSNGGTQVDSITQDYGSLIMKPQNPVIAEGIFEGWYINSELTISVDDFNTMPANDITLYAKWKMNQYTITFDSNGGSEITPITRDYGSYVSNCFKPAKDGYHFLGCYKDKEMIEEYQFGSMPNENITVYAKWEPKKYTISFHSNSGSYVNPITQDFGSIVSKVNDPKRQDYTFAGWYLDEEETTPYEFGIMPNHNITLYAKWIIGSTEGLEYSLLDDDTYSISGYHGNSQYVRVPKYYNNKLVTAIGERAFNSQLITTVIFDEDIQLTTINDEAFYYASNLLNITIPNGVTTIGNRAFSNAIRLTSINIPASVTEIGKDAFYKTSGLRIIIVDINNDFYSSINGILFDKDQKTLISCPSNISEIPYFEIPDTVEIIRTHAFAYQNRLDYVLIPNSVLEIEKQAFYWGCSIINIVFEEDSQITKIDDETFYGAIGLTSITIPRNVISLNYRSFANTLSLTKVTFEEGSQLTTIGKEVFSNADILTSFTIPSSVIWIDEYVFLSAEMLESIIITSEIPPGISAYAFIITNSEQPLKIYVPSQSEATYKAKYPWVYFKDQIYPIDV